MTTGHEEYATKLMLAKPVTEAGRLIGANWFKSPNELSEKSGVPMHWISAAIHGNEIPERWLEVLKQFFATL